MIRGEVRENGAAGLEPWVTIDVEDADGTLHPHDVLIDTGFTGWLTLPEADIRQLGLSTHDHTQVVLATGEIRVIDYCIARIGWQGTLQQVVVFQSRDQSMLGMQLLKGSVITMQAWGGGGILIERPASE